MDTVDTPIEENNEVIIPVLLMFATVMFGVPLKLNAVEAIPVTFPTNP